MIRKLENVEDVDFHFPDRIALKSDNGKVTMFMPIEFFIDNKYIRKLKLDKIKNVQRRSL